MPLPTLATDHLDLVPLDAPHARLYRALYTDARVMARIGTPLDVAAADAAFVRAVQANRAAAPRHRTWAAVERSTARALGIGALSRRPNDTELGLMLLPAAWNARYSHEVVDALVAHAFDDLGVDRLTGICRAGPNERMSRRLLRVHGFVDAPPDRPGTACWALQRSAWARPVGSAGGGR